MRDWRFRALLGLFLLLLGLHLLTPGLDSDQAVTGLMGMHVLRGEFPIFFWRQDHGGVPEAYAVAVSFFLFGVSRYALNLVPALAAVGLAVTLYRTGAVLFGHGAGLLAVLFATAVSPYVAAHYVVARAYYVEHLLAGQLVILGAALWLARPLSEPARARVLLAMGLAAGAGLYMGFQIGGELVAALGALLLIDPRLPLRRAAWLGLGAFLLGSTPLWIYNAIHAGATFQTAVRFEGHEPTREAASVFLLNLATVLGAEPSRHSLSWAARPWTLAAPAVAGLAVAFLASRVVRGWRRLRRAPELAGEAMLLVAVLTTVGLVWAGHYLSAPRYLVPLVPPLAVILARACQLVWCRSRLLAAAGVAVYLLVMGGGLVGSIPSLWPARRAAYWSARADDEALLAFLRDHGLRRVYSPDYWLALRLTFDAGEEVIVAQPFGARYPAYTRAVDASPRTAYVVRAGAGLLLDQLHAFGTRAERTRVGRYAVVWQFGPIAPLAPLPRAGWTIRTSPGLGEAASLTDGLLESGWSSARAEPAWVELDLGAPRAVAGVTLVAPGAERAPAVLGVAVADGPAWAPVARRERGEVALTWRNAAPRLAYPQSFTVRFPAVVTRQLRLEADGSAAIHVAELFVLGSAGASTPCVADLQDGARLEATGAIREALLRYRAAMRAAPDDPEGYLGFARLAREVGLSQGTAVERAEHYARLGMTEEARAAYARAADRLGPVVAHAELAESRRRFALARGDVGEAHALEVVRDAVLTPRRRVHAVFGRLVELTGYDLEPAQVRPGGTLRVAYHWRLRAPATQPLVAQVELEGRLARLRDDHPLPASIDGLRGGSQHVLERRSLVIPEDAEPGRYRLLVSVWDPASGRRLRRWRAGVLPVGSRTVELGAVEVFPRP